MSHPLGFIEGSKDFESCISRCAHSVYQVWNNPKGRSSACEICNSEIEREKGIVRRRLSKKELSKAAREIEKVAPSIVEEFTETDIEEDVKESDAETNFVEEDSPKAYREEAEEVEVGD